MKLITTLIFVFIFFGFINTYAQNAKVTGRVTYKGEPKKKIKVSITNGGSHAVTTNNGYFTSNFEDSISPGASATITVEEIGTKNQWVVIKPFLGHILLQNEITNADSLPVEISEKKSPLLLESSQLNSLVSEISKNTDIGRILSQTTLSVSSDLSNRKTSSIEEISKTKVISDYSKFTGFSIKEIISALDIWASSKDFSSFEEKANKEFYKKNYKLAAKFYKLARTNLLTTIKEKEKDLLKEYKELMDIHFSEISSLYNLRELKKLQDSASELEKLFTEKESLKKYFLMEWAGMRLVKVFPDMLISISQGNVEKIVSYKKELESILSIIEKAPIKGFEDKLFDLKFLQGALLLFINFKLLDDDASPNSTDLIVIERIIEHFNICSKNSICRENPYYWYMFQNTKAGLLYLIGSKHSWNKSNQYLRDSLPIWTELLNSTYAKSDSSLRAYFLLQRGKTHANLVRKSPPNLRVNHFKHSISDLNTASNLFTKEETSYRWAQTHFEMGALYYFWSNDKKGKMKLDLLSKAEKDLLTALEYLSIKNDYITWTSTNAFLASINTQYAAMQPPNEAYKYRRKALKYYSDVAMIYRPKLHPDDWSEIHLIRINELFGLATLTKDKLRQHYLDVGIKTYIYFLKYADCIKYRSRCSEVEYILEKTLYSLASNSNKNQGVEYYNNAIKLISDWSKANDFEENEILSLKAQVDLGKLYYNLAIFIQGPESYRYLEKSFAEYEKVLEKTKLCTEKNKCQQFKIISNKYLAKIWHDKGLNARSQEESLRYFDRSLEKYDHIFQEFLIESDRYEWLLIRKMYADTLIAKGYIVNTPSEKEIIVKKAIFANQEIIRLLKLDKKYPAWIELKYAIAYSHSLIKDFAESLRILNEILDAFPNEKNSLSLKSRLLHEDLARFDESFQINTQILELNPTIIDKLNFAENLLTVSKYSECIDYISKNIDYKQLPQDISVVAQFINISCMLGSNKTQNAKQNLALLTAEINALQSSKVNWSFNGTSKYLKKTKNLSSYRKQLLAIIKSFEKEDLRSLKKSIKSLDKKVKK